MSAAVFCIVGKTCAYTPIPANDTAEFNPVIFDCQSRLGDPAVLTILATREGTCITVIDNKRDAFEVGHS